MSKREPNPNVITFFERLDRLDAGGRARLKRSAGQSMSEARRVIGLFYSVLPPSVPNYQHDAFFLVATLYALADGGGEGNFGAALRQARRTENVKGLNRRVETLLDADDVQLPFRLRQAVHFLQSKRVRIDWPRLLEDLLNWTHADRFVQRQWAQSYFAE